MDKVYRLIIENATSGKIEKHVAAEMLKDLKHLNATASTERKADDNEGIAIIGISAEFPSARDIHEYWDNIYRKADSVSRFPEERKADLGSYPAKFLNLSPDDNVHYLDGAYLDEIKQFDYPFFRISPKEARLMDPAQRIFLQTVWHAIEDSGYGPSKLKGSKVGVYVGYAPNAKDNYHKMIMELEPESIPLSMIGNITAMLPTRISYLLDLKGPTMVLDTACSSSLVSIHTACQAIRSGDCDVAIAGAVKLNILPVRSSHLKIGIESSDDKTRAFDEHADGSGIGEGVAAVILKPLTQALKDGDNIYAVIKGSAINQDGASIGITAPNQAAQEEVITKAWEDAGIHPETLSFIEAHGTGTNLGDPLEIEGLTRAFNKYTAKKHFCAIGSAKSNTGHLYECAGMAGFIKSVLALKNRIIPPTIHFEHPNRKIQFHQSPVYVNTKARIWERGSSPRRCGVSAFGLSGTNCHLVLEEAPEQARVQEKEGQSWHVLALSAKSQSALSLLIDRYVQMVKDQLPEALGAICCTAANGREHYAFRVAILAENEEDLRSKLINVGNGNLSSLSQEAWFFSGAHTVLPEGREAQEHGDMSENEKQQLSVAARQLLHQRREHGGDELSIFTQLCDLYVLGADIQWGLLYEVGHYSKVSLPVYPFDPHPCWLDIPATANERSADRDKKADWSDEHLFFGVSWRKEERVALPDVSAPEQRTFLFLHPNRNFDQRTIEVLRAEGHRVFDVHLSERYEWLNTEQATITGAEADYISLWKTLKDRDIDHIVYLGLQEPRGEASELAELERRKFNGIYSFLQLMKHSNLADNSRPLQVTVALKQIYAISGNEQELYPEHAMLFAMGKVVSREHPQVRCVCLDIDEQMDEAALAAEIIHPYPFTSAIGYREGQRYVEEFGPTATAEHPEDPIQLLDGGVYVITGGLGGIGFEVAKHLAALNPQIQLALINRSPFPDKDLWPSVLKENKENHWVSRIHELSELELAGVRVTIHQADTANPAAMANVLDEIREHIGPLKGIIHGAGISIEKPLVSKTLEEFSQVLTPKVDGTWLLDSLTRNDKLDFFVMFSSVATVFSSIWQADYAAANAYMDAFAEQRSRAGLKTLSINWNTWSEVGMAAKNGFAASTIFKALTTEDGVKGFNEILSRHENRVLIGRLNFEGGGISLLERSSIRLSSDLKDKAESVKQRKSDGSAKSFVSKGQGEVLLTGKDGQDYTQIEKELAEVFKQILGFREIHIHDNFFEMGADSIHLIQAHDKVDKLYPGLLTVIDMFQYTTIFKLAQFISGKHSSPSERSGIFKEREAGGQDIAIIGLSAKLPLAEDVREFWNNLKYGQDCIIPFPVERRQAIDRLLAFRGISSDSVDYAKGAFLDNIDQFDYPFFRLSPKEASLTDPNQRLFLQVAWQAIEDAGYGGNKIYGTNTGVFVGFSSHPVESYSKLIYEIDPFMLSMSIVGNTTAVITGRLSYLLDLKGPSMVVDTACSSSLVSVHTACEAIRNGECEMAIAGGVRLEWLPITPKNERIGIGMESVDGRTRAFDDNSDGTGTGEGVAAVLLKPLERALKDGDQIYAVIKGNAVNQDGSSIGITAPNPAAQVEVIRKAWEKAGIDPETIGYIETHGTGTQLGDPIEIQSVQEAFRSYTSKKHFCAVGSVKTNIGHLSEAAGITGLVKAVLALNNEEIPPNLHFNKPNEKIAFYDSPVYVNTKLKKWKRGSHPRRCGVSAFGMSGTNCHLVLEEAPIKAKLNEEQNTAHILTISAKNEGTLQRFVDNYNKFLSDRSHLSVGDVCYTANTGRGHYGFRIAVVVQNEEDLRKKLAVLHSVESYEHFDEPWFYFGVHKTVTEGKQSGPNEKSDKDKLDLGDLANKLICGLDFSKPEDKGSISQLCRMYVQGAEVDWELLYEGKSFYKTSIPVYPFEPKSAWVDIPAHKKKKSVIESGINRYYQTVWKKEALPVDETGNFGQFVVVFKDEEGRADELIKLLSAKGKTVIQVRFGNEYKQLEEKMYQVGSTEQDYHQLLNQIEQKESISQIVHMGTMAQRGEATQFDELQVRVQQGVRSLFYLTKALIQNYKKNNVEIVLLTNLAHEVTGGENAIVPENASLIGLGRIIGQEYPAIGCRSIDTDEFTSMEQIMPEIERDAGRTYQVAYRGGRRFIEEFRDVDIRYEQDLKTEIRPQGVYIITGGTGGMGMETAKYIASKASVNLILVSRSDFPSKDSWEEFLQTSSDSKMKERLIKVMELERMGSSVELLKADLRSFNEIQAALASIRHRYGRIHGIVHSAGIAGDGFLARKDENTFLDVIEPKIYGTWAFDWLTRNDSLDFYVMFSSIATTLSTPGQGDYVAANAYLDAYAAYRSRSAGKTLTINWPSWKETGMALQYGANVDTVFKAIETKMAIEALDELLSKNIQRMTVGELNEEASGVDYLLMLDQAPFQLSYKIRDAIAEAKKIRTSGEVSSFSHSSPAEVKLTGKEGADYSEAEDALARIYGEILGFHEIHIHDNFFEIGGDSVLLGKMHLLIEKKFPGKVKLTELFEYTTISSLGAFIAGDASMEKIEKLSIKSETQIESELDQLIEGMEKGNLSVEDALDALNRI